MITEIKSFHHNFNDLRMRAGVQTSTLIGLEDEHSPAATDPMNVWFLPLKSHTV